MIKIEDLSKDQLEKLATESVNTALSWLNSAGEFVAEQAPLFIQDFINYHLAYHSILLAAYLAVFILVYTKVRSWIKSLDKEMEEEGNKKDEALSTFWILFHVLKFFSFFILIGFAYNLFKITVLIVSPRMYIFNYLMEMKQSMGK